MNIKKLLLSLLLLLKKFKPKKTAKIKYDSAKYYVTASELDLFSKGEIPKEYICHLVRIPLIDWYSKTIIYWIKKGQKEGIYREYLSHKDLHKIICRIKKEMKKGRCWECIESAFEYVMKSYSLPNTDNQPKVQP